jgi:hypothetical protein
MLAQEGPEVLDELSRNVRDGLIGAFGVGESELERRKLVVKEGPRLSRNSGPDVIGGFMERPRCRHVTVSNAQSQ